MRNPRKKEQDFPKALYKAGLMMSETIVVVTKQVQFQFCSMNLDELNCNLWEILLDSIRTYFVKCLRLVQKICTYTKIIIGSLTYGNKFSLNTFCLFFNQKFETFKEILPSLVFNLRQCFYCAKLINIRSFPIYISYF